jgi:hypothetical protein
LAGRVGEVWKGAGEVFDLQVSGATFTKLLFPERVGHVDG